MRREASSAPTGHDKAASISIFLLEELGDARVRCAQLKKYLDDATELIEKSEQRDAIFETAGHLIHGIPEVVFKLEKALEAASLAANKIDSDEVEERLKPEKVQELQRALEDTRIRHVKRRSEEGKDNPMKTAMHQTGTVIFHALKELFADGMQDYPDMRLSDRENVGAQAAQAAQRVSQAVSQVARLAQHPRSLEIPHEAFLSISDNLFDLVRATGAAAQGHIKSQESRAQGPKIAGEERTMNAKTAAQELITIASEVETTGRVPLHRLIALTARLERGRRTASVSGADPRKVGAFFRNLAAEMLNPPDGKHPSRHALAARLRPVLADQMPVGMEQAAAQIYQQANSREDVMKGFKESNPSMTDEQLESAADNWEKHKSVVKDMHK